MATSAENDFIVSFIIYQSFINRWKEYFHKKDALLIKYKFRDIWQLSKLHFTVSGFKDKSTKDYNSLSKALESICLDDIIQTLRPYCDPTFMENHWLWTATLLISTSNVECFRNGWRLNDHMSVMK